MTGFVASRIRLRLLAERLAGWWPLAHRSRRPLTRWTDEALDRRLAARGRNRAHLFLDCPGTAPHRRRMARMMAHFGVRPEQAVCEFWGVLKAADQTCVACPNTRRCISWLDWPVGRDAPRVFCPNTGVFDAIAYAGRESEQDMATPVRLREKVLA